MTTENHDATQTGVPGAKNTGNVASTTEETTRELSARELAMEAIAEGRQGTFDAESRGDQTDQQLAAQLEPLATLPAPTRVKVKIDGVESEVTLDELTRQYQKNGAAERRLEEATRLLNEARAAVPPVGFAPPASSSESTPVEPQPQGGTDEAKAFLAALFDGDEVKALEALQKIGLGRPQPTQNTAQLAAQLTPAIKQQLVVDSALEKFTTDYADIVKDPYLADLADRFLDAEVANGTPFTEALEAAGQKTRDWLGSKGVTQASPSPTMNRDTKLERKAGIDSIPALNTKATTVEEPEQSAQDVIREMRKSRGLEV